MTTPTLNRAQVRDIDRRAIEEYGLSGLVLMENAGRGVADTLCQLAAKSPVVICCGKGNNGGDGFVIARHLDLRNIDVRVMLFAAPDELRGDAAVNFEVLRRAGVPIEVFGHPLDVPRLDEQLGQAGWIVDALLGTGTTGEPRPPLDAVIERINRHVADHPRTSFVMAVDLPSGLDCDTGRAAGATIRASHTCTFVAQKPGFLLPEARQFIGQVHVLDIGAPRKLIETISAIGI